MSRTVSEVLPVLYLRGLSTGDFREGLAALLGENAAGLSPSAITRLTTSWQEEYRAWRTRPLADRTYVYVWADGVHFNVRLEDERLAALVEIGGRPDGTKEVVALEEGYRESTESWLALLRDLKARGMRAPVLNGHELLPLVRAGVNFKDAVRVERNDAAVNKDAYDLREEEPQMQRRPPPLANIITLGVQNFDAQRHFYRQLGWPQAFDSDDFTVFELRGALLALFPIDKLASDAHAQPEPGRGGIRFSIIIGVDTPEEVDELAARVRQAGGKLTKNPTDAEFFVGRDAYFADPEGNYWEIACAPPDNPVVSASRRAAGVAPRRKRLKPGRKVELKGKKKAK